MSKLIIMRGLPASGKSTRAKEIIEATGNTVRVNKDLLRKMLHFDKWSGNNENITKDVARLVVKDLLKANINVIVDDTNLNPGTFQSWKDLAKEIPNLRLDIEDMDAPLEECLKRDAGREDKVGENVIIGMAMQAGIYPKPEKGIVICDLDGTLADVEHRRHFVKQEPKDWKSFFTAIKDDPVRDDIANMAFNFHKEGYEVFIVSGRPEGGRSNTDGRRETEAWLKDKGITFYKSLFMRRSDDKRPDTEVKKKIFDKYFKNYSIHKVIDDRPSVIRMWREQGLDVIDVGNGEEF